MIFEELVCKSLKEKGHQVELQVGCSGYRIDLAIVDPEHPGRYLLGIECDGATYHRAKTARDRDKLRESVLHQLGWEIHRIWSIDWWENPQREIERIEEALAAAQTKLEARNKSPINAIVQPPSRIAKNIVVQPTPQEVPSITNARQYLVCELPLVSKTQEEFYFESNNLIIYKQISDIIKVEGPISHSLLCRRIISTWGMSKVGSRIDSRIQNLAANMKLKTTKSDSMVYYWPEQIEPKDYTIFRTPHIEKRDIKDILPEEIRNAAIEILNNQISLPESDLIRKAAKLIGFRKGAKVDMRIRSEVDRLIKDGFAMRGIGGSIVVTK